MKKFDTPLRTYVNRVYPSLTNLQGWSVIDSEMIRIFYLDAQGGKKSQMIKAPLPNEL